MFRFAYLTLIVVGITSFASAQESLTTAQTETRPSFESLKTRAEDFIAKKEDEVRRLELMLAEKEAKICKSRKELAEYDRHMESQLKILQFVHERRGQSQDSGVILVGNRRYSLKLVEANVNSRLQEIADIGQICDKKECAVKDLEESLRNQKSSLNLVKHQLAKAKAVLAEQQSRWERGAVDDIVQQICPKGELLFASGTKLADILGDIEIEVGTREALFKMRHSGVEIDLSDIGRSEIFIQK